MPKAEDIKDAFYSGFVTGLMGMPAPIIYEDAATDKFPLCETMQRGRMAGRDLLATKEGLALRNKLQRFITTAFQNGNRNAA